MYSPVAGGFLTPIQASSGDSFIPSGPLRACTFNISESWALPLLSCILYESSLLTRLMSIFPQESDRVF